MADDHVEVDPDKLEQLVHEIAGAARDFENLAGQMRRIAGRAGLRGDRGVAVGAKGAELHGTLPYLRAHMDVARALSASTPAGSVVWFRESQVRPYLRKEEQAQALSDAGSRSPGVRYISPHFGFNPGLPGFGKLQAAYRLAAGDPPATGWANAPRALQSYAQEVMAWKSVCDNTNYCPPGFKALIDKIYFTVIPAMDNVGSGWKCTIFGNCDYGPVVKSIRSLYSSLGTVSEGPESNETWHSTLRGGPGERNIDSNEVIRNAEGTYYNQDGNQVYVWPQGDGLNQVVVRDPASGNVITRQWSSDSLVERMIDEGEWYELG